MFASFRKYFWLCLCALLFLAGCDAEESAPEVSEIGEKTQATLFGLGGASFCQNGVTNGEDCDTDGDLCDGEICVAGNCEDPDPATPKVCADADTTDCDTSACDPLDGACKPAFEPTSHVCTTDGADAVPCTDDRCDGAGLCVSTPNSNNCSDSYACTDDVCDPGTGDANGCRFDPVNTNCDDGFSCTDNFCDPGNGDAAGCRYDAIHTRCTDAFACTADSCDPANGAAVTGCVNDPENTACTDAFACTDDICDPGNGDAAGCRFPPNDGNCNDAFACTNNICDPGNGDANGCRFPADDANCDDNIGCTTNICDPGNGDPAGCRFAEDDAFCADAHACTIDECTTTVTPDGSGCVRTPDANVCVDPDRNNCRDMSCSLINGCQENVNRTSPPTPGYSDCNDNIACTVDEWCNNGVCQGEPDDSLCSSLTTSCAIGKCSIVNDCQPEFATLAGALCRPRAGDCDVAERCPASPGDAGYGSCPIDTFIETGTQCSDPSCGSGQQIDAATCAGTADCPTANVVDCTGYACTSDTTPICQFECTSDDECLPTYYCDLSQGTPGTCEERLSAGVSCTDDTPCGQGDQCVDGVCCNSECGGQCQACDVPGSEGQCVPVTGAPHPGGPSGAQRRACDGDGTECDGSCDGSNVSSCTFPAAGEACLAPSCQNGQAFEQPTCDGDGACVQPTPQECDPFTCDGDVCRGDCTLDSHCQGNQQCNAGMCVSLFDDGDQCSVGSECQSGHCVDEVCCASACSGQCEACDVSGREGQCVAVSGAPHGGRPDCAGSGPCEGRCDGSNRTRCAFPSTDTSCGDASCDAADSEATVAAYCNGAGTCAEIAPIECPDGCEGDLCANGECVVDSDCSGSDVCRAALCVPPSDDGAACASDNECESGNCVDGVCCDTACGGQCEACDVQGSIGTCTAIDDGEQPHGARQPCTSDGTLCGGTCDGSSTDTCSYPTSGVCHQPSCAGGVATVEASCNGTGLCPALMRQDCMDLGCSGDVCDGDCADGSACGNGQYCSAGICVDILVDGSSCASDDQCDSGNCVDGFCCNTACDSQCAACDVAGFEGICAAVTGAPHGSRPACEGSNGACGSTCDGQEIDSCAFPDGTVCGASTCSLGALVDEATCDGAGRCTPGETTRCNTLECTDAGECATECTEDDDCPLNEICLSDGSCGEDPLINAVDKGSCGCRIAGGHPDGEGHTPPWILLSPLVLLALRRRRPALASTATRTRFR